MENIIFNKCSFSNDDSGSYQLGDHILGRNNKGKYDNDHYLITDVKYHNTILGRLAKKLQINNGNNKHELVVEIIKEMIKNNKYDLSKENDIVIHLRLGDVFDLPNDEKYLTDKIPHIEPILKIIKNNKNNNKIIFVTAYSFGPGIFSEEDRIKNGLIKSKNFMQNIIDNIPSNMPYEIKSSENIDEDFIYLVTAKKLFITSKSGFSLSALKINKMIKHKKE